MEGSIEFFNNLKIRENQRNLQRWVNIDIENYHKIPKCQHILPSGAKCNKKPSLKYGMFGIFKYLWIKRCEKHFDESLFKR